MRPFLPRPLLKSAVYACLRYNDIQDSWESVTTIVDWVGDNAPTNGMLAAAGPGHFNDPDMLIIGNFGLSYEQSKAQMALWSIMAAPLLMGNDLRNLDPKLKEILLAEEVRSPCRSGGLRGRCRPPRLIAAECCCAAARVRARR